MLLHSWVQVHALWISFYCLFFCKFFFRRRKVYFLREIRLAWSVVFAQFIYFVSVVVVSFPMRSAYFSVVVLLSVWMCLSLSLLILLSLPLTVAPNAVDAFHCFCIIVYLWFLFYSIHSCFDIIFVCHFILLSLCCWCVYNFSLFHNGKILLRIIELLRGIVRLNPIGKYVSTVKNHAFAGAIFIFPVWMMGSQVGASIAYTLNWRWRVLLMW